MHFVLNEEIYHRNQRKEEPRMAWLDQLITERWHVLTSSLHSVCNHNVSIRYPARYKWERTSDSLILGWWWRQCHRTSKGGCKQYKLSWGCHASHGRPLKWCTPSHRRTESSIRRLHIGNPVILKYLIVEDSIGEAQGQSEVLMTQNEQRLGAAKRWILAGIQRNENLEDVTLRIPIADAVHQYEFIINPFQ